jgi:hypothetical protein
MRRITLLAVMLLAVSVWAQNSGAGTAGAASGASNAAGQNMPGTAPNAAPNAMPTAQPIAPANPNPQPGPNGLINNGGYVTSGPMSPPLLLTPSVSSNVASPNPVGAVSGTGNNVVGASSSAINNMPSTPEPPVLSQPQISNPNLTSVNTTAETINAGAAINSANQMPNMNLGVTGSYGVGGVTGSYGVGGVTGSAGVSDTRAAAQPQTLLGDIGRQARARHNANARVYTNDDVNRIAQNDRGGVTTLNNSNNTLPMSDQNAVPTTSGVAGAATSAAPGNPAPANAPTVGRPAQPPPAQSPDHTPPRKREPFGPPAQPPQ